MEIFLRNGAAGSTTVAPLLLPLGRYEILKFRSTTPGARWKHGVNPVAFNFLYYRKGTWIYVFQPQSFNAVGQAPLQRLIGQATTRSVF